MGPIRTLLLFSLGVLACGPGGNPEPPAQGPVTFQFRMRGDGSGTQDFRAVAATPELIAEARAQLKLPVAQRKHVAGPLAAGNGGVNLNWSWHFTGFAFAEASIELCDGTPAMVEQNLDYWLNTVRTFCPWNAYVHAELP